jgi:hypothetical protein
MIPKELTEQVQREVQGLKEAADEFLQTYREICVHCDGQRWQKEPSEMVFHHVRSEVIPIMEQAGMDPQAVQALCSWAERRIRSR